MGIDLSNMFQGVQDAASQTWSDIQTTGVPALEATVEQYGAQQLQKMSNQSTQNANAGITAIQKRPVQPGSFASTFSSVFGGIGQTQVFQQYGLIILAGGAVVLYLIIRK